MVPSRLTTYGFLAAFVVTFTVVDLATPEGQSLGSVFAVAPVLVAVDGTRRTILFTGGFALVLSTWLNWYNADYDALEFSARVLAVLAATAIGLLAHDRRTKRERRLAQVLRVAEASQRAVLPSPLPRVGPLEVAASYASAAEEAQIGGDFYRIVETPWGVRAIIGDVRGKGLPAVRITAGAISVFREAAYDEPDLERVAARMDRSLLRESDLEGFVTVLLLSVDADGHCTAASYGHPPPLLRDRSGVVSELDMPAALPLGLGLGLSGDGTGAATPVGPAKEIELRLADGDELLLVTDGVLEARDKHGGFYPLAERYTAMPRDCTPGEMLAALRHDLEVTCGANGLSDDSAVVLLRYSPYAPRRIRPS